LKIGILALQGAVSPHKEKLIQLGAEPVEIRKSIDLEGLSGSIIPGGESTTFIHLLKLNDLWEPLRLFAASKPTWGVCAGAILLAKKVLLPSQPSLELLDIEIERNAFGRQIHSFIDTLTPLAQPNIPDWRPLEGVFIRAPRIKHVGPYVKILFEWKQEPVMVEQFPILATTFHPELTENSQIHEYFLKNCR